METGKVQGYACFHEEMYIRQNATKWCEQQLSCLFVFFSILRHVVYHLSTVVLLDFLVKNVYVEIYKCSIFDKVDLLCVWKKK